MLRWVVTLVVLLGAGGLAGGFFLGGCSRLPEVTAPWTESPRESYAASLEQAGLASTALGRAWLAAGENALAHAVEVQAPYRETVYFDPSDPEAAGFRLELRRGQRLRVGVLAEADRGGADRAEGDDGALESDGEAPEAERRAERLLAAQPVPRHFVEIFEAPRTVGGEPRRLASGDRQPSDEPLALEEAVRRDGALLVRVQPELLAGGRFTVTLEAEPSLTFPVEGRDSAAIRSFFGDPRDAGHRRHKGVDIFAERGTPALAAADGRVLRVGTNRLGGKTVWMYAEGLGLAFYYAHLDRQSVRRGQRVRAGETVGRVGNTGNARSTPPHLHFEIRDGGALDPWPFLHRTPGEPPELEVDPAILGGWHRVRREGSRLRIAPRRDAGLIGELSRGTPVALDAGVGDWLRVRLPDGRRGFLAASLTEPANRPLRSFRLERPELLRHRPTVRAPAVAELLGGEEIGVLGESAEALYVEAAAGRRGWIVPPRS